MAFRVVQGCLLFVFLLNKTLPQKFRAIPAKLLRKKIGLRGRNQRPDTGQSSWGWWWSGSVRPTDTGSSSKGWMWQRTSQTTRHWIIFQRLKVAVDQCNHQTIDLPKVEVGSGSVQPRDTRSNYQILDLPKVEGGSGPVQPPTPDNLPEVEGWYWTIKLADSWLSIWGWINGGTH